MAKDIYQILRIQTLLSHKGAGDTSIHHMSRKDSHIDERQGDESSEELMNSAMPQVHGSSDDTQSSLSI